MTGKRKFIVPEVVQTSGMDCGPASLKCLLEGHGISVSYGRLREACQTDVDGTSIDTMEAVANKLGLKAEQILIPVDNLFIKEEEAFPAIIVVRLPNGFTHFLVVWSQHGNFLQIMDPATGRRVMSTDRFLEEVYRHTMVVPADAWREWAGEARSLEVLKLRINALGISNKKATELVTQASADPGWLGLASLDSAIRMTQSLLKSGAFKKGAEIEKLLERMFQSRTEGETMFDTIPENYWSIKPDEDTPNHVRFTGAVLVRVTGAEPLDIKEDGSGAPEGLSGELLAALTEKQPSPLQIFLEILGKDGVLAPSVMLSAIAISGAAFILESLMLRSVLDLGEALGLGWQRFLGAGLLMVFFALITALHFPTFRIIMAMGRHLEVRLRTAFMEKIPHIGDRYFQSRPRSDMAERSHRIMDIRKLPLQSGRLVLGISEAIIVTAAICWFYPQGALLAIALMITALALPLMAHPVLSEIDMKVRTHMGALSKFYLDGLLGLIPLRAHVAEGAMRHQHERLVVEWVRSKHKFIYTSMTSQGLRLVGTSILTILLIFSFLNSDSNKAYSLLFIYWVLQLPTLGQFMAQLILQYPGHRNLTLRLLEPLGTPNETSVMTGEEVADDPREDAGKGIHLKMENLSVVAAGNLILSELNLEVRPGEQVAVVGPSGAGKSTLIGLLLGWYTPSSGKMTINDKNLDGSQLEWLRARTAWVDPAVQIWNRSFLHNLRYGQMDESAMSDTLEQADLLGLLEKMPDGLQTDLGEGGSLVSGGEGQRVRLGRAMLRRYANCVILDEPFRGLDRDTRHKLMSRARNLWKGATFFCVTHDISETRDFERVLVVENGKLVEDGNPAQLAADENTSYHRLLQAEKDAMEKVWNDPNWRKLYLHKGHLTEAGGAQ